MPLFRRSAGWLHGLCLLTLFGAAAGALRAQEIPARLNDATFWNLVSTYSEVSGSFPSENFLSNEAGFQRVIPALLRTVPAGRAYIGVGPEQNFTYVAALHPSIAFVVDIRRQAVLQHLLYKALFEMAPDRVHFLSVLFSRPRPHGLTDQATAAELFAAFGYVAPDSALYRTTLAAVKHRLVASHHFELSDDDLADIEHIFGVIFAAGPGLNYNSGSAVIVRPAPIPPMPPLTFLAGANPPPRRDVIVPADSGTTRPVERAGDRTSAMPASVARDRYTIADYASLMTETDSAGVSRSYLASEANYGTVREMERRNLIVPIVGDFGGDHALVNVAAFLRSTHAVVGAFYTSNVEQYLFPNGMWRAFYDNVAALPRDSASTFIRSLGQTAAGHRPGLVSALGSINGLLQAIQAGQIAGYADVARLSQPW
ncbi:MAG TPA: hypothetical protein VHW65_11835 [Gemmatimonadales bacterium]|jgi:hypothetical protein|nr:hypothetical protein [Gemmatimonadales bacterium]